VAMFAFVGGETFENFITHFEPFEMNDADVFGAVFPDLPLLKFQCHVISQKLSLRIQIAERQVNYFFLPAACLLAVAAFFLAAMLLALEFF
jgi:hypothetical protein